MNGDTSTSIPHLRDMNTCASNLEETFTWIPKLVDVNLYLVNAFLQFLNRQKGKNKENSAFISKLNVAISNLSSAFHLADYDSNQLQVRDDIELIFYLAVRFDLLKAHNEGIARINRQGINNLGLNGTIRTKQDSSEDESNNEMSDDKSEKDSRHAKSGNLENESNSTDKEKEKQGDPGERIQVFVNCEECEKTFQEEKELKDHKELWRGSSWSCASGKRFPEKKLCNVCNGSFLARDKLEHEKGCPGSKTNSCEESVKTFPQNNVLITHKRANPNAEKEYQNGETDISSHRSKMRKKNNVEEEMISELKEEQGGIDSNIDIKEETMEVEGIEDPLISVEPSPLGSPAQIDPCSVKLLNIATNFNYAFNIEPTPAQHFEEDIGEEGRFMIPPPEDLNVGQRQELAELKFKRLFRGVVIHGKRRKTDVTHYKSLFLRTTNLATLDGGLKSVMNETNSLLHGVMTWAGLNLSDRQHHFNNSWFAMNIVAILEYEKPGFFTLMRPKQKGTTEDVHYDILKDEITNARIKEIGRLLHCRFLNYCDDKTCIESSNVGANRRKRNSDSITKSVPGKKCRRGKNPARSYCPVGFIPGISPIIENIDTDDNKMLVENLLRKCSANQWQENCPVLFSDLRRLQEFTEWSYEPSHDNDGVIKLDLLNHQRSLDSKLRDLVLVVKSLCQEKDINYESYVSDDMTLEDALQVETTGIKEEVDIIKAIRVLGKITSAGRYNKISGHTISVYPERKISGCAIHINIIDGKLLYCVSVEGTELFPTTNIMDAIQAYFLMTMVANLGYHNGATCFGFIMEHWLYGRPQTVKLPRPDLKSYSELRSFWNSLPAVASKLPTLG